MIRLSALSTQQLTRTDFCIIQKTFLIICGSIFCEAGKDLGLLAKQFYNFRIGADTKGTNQHSDRNLSGSVYTNIKNIVGVCFIFQPLHTLLRNYGAGKQPFTNFIMCDCIIDSRGTYQLAYDNTLCTVDYKCACFRH